MLHLHADKPAASQLGCGACANESMSLSNYWEPLSLLAKSKNCRTVAHPIHMQKKTKTRQNGQGHRQHRNRIHGPTLQLPGCHTLTPRGCWRENQLEFILSGEAVAAGWAAPSEGATCALKSTCRQAQPVRGFESKFAVHSGNCKQAETDRY